MKEKTIVLDGGTIALQNWGPLAFLASQMLCEDLIYDMIFVLSRFIMNHLGVWILCYHTQ